MKKKYIAGALSIAGLFVLASCNSSNVIIEDSTLYPTNAVSGSDIKNTEESNKLLYDPVYESTTATITTVDSASSATSVEETVEKVYDSVVSITASSVSSFSLFPACIDAIYE